MLRKLFLVVVHPPLILSLSIQNVKMTRNCWGKKKQKKTSEKALFLRAADTLNIYIIVRQQIPIVCQSVLFIFWRLHCFKCPKYVHADCNLLEIKHSLAHLRSIFYVSGAGSLHRLTIAGVYYGVTTLFYILFIFLIQKSQFLSPNNAIYIQAKGPRKIKYQSCQIFLLLFMKN